MNNTATLEIQRAARDLARTDQAIDPLSLGLYPWVFMPPSGKTFSSFGSVQSPAYGVANQVVICSYTVPAGFNAVLLAVMHSFFGSNFVPGSGSIIWSIDVDRPPGASPTSGYFVPGFSAVLIPLGSPDRNPWPIMGGERFRDAETIRYKVQTANPVGVGDPNYISAALLGWIWPDK